MNYVTLNDGTQVPSLGMGTWYLGEGRRSAAEEERALRAGIEAGITLIDTAEMYGDGAPRSCWDGPSGAMTGMSSFWCQGVPPQRGPEEHLPGL